jgi:Uma2 family endonuclease
MALFVSYSSFRSRRVRLVKGREEGFTELIGVPDLVIEVVSASSEDKDTEWLMKSFWEAGIPEYWLIDARYEPLQFDIFRRTAKGYSPARKQGGWLKSGAMGRSFRLTQGVNALGQPEYTLSVR